MTPRKAVTLLAVILPIVAMIAWIASIERRIAQGATVQLRITGYDPRDLLAGHYLTYSVDYGGPVCPASSNDTPAHCVCLDQKDADEPAQASWNGTCEERPEGCAVHLKGRCVYGRFVAGIERFYIPESRAPELATVPAGASIVAKVGGGRGIVTGLLIEGKNLDQYFQELQGTRPAD